MEIILPPLRPLRRNVLCVAHTNTEDGLRNQSQSSHAPFRPTPPIAHPLHHTNDHLGEHHNIRHPGIHPQWRQLAHLSAACQMEVLANRCDTELSLAMRRAALRNLALAILSQNIAEIGAAEI